MQCSIKIINTRKTTLANVKKSLHLLNIYGPPFSLTFLSHTFIDFTDSFELSSTKYKLSTVFYFSNYSLFDSCSVTVKNAIRKLIREIKKDI